jgi:glycosyltransferase involved in cell wall biosynthesis
MSRRDSIKILFLTSSYPRHTHDVAAVFLRYFAESLVGQGNQVHVLAPADGKSATAIDGAITVHRFQYFPQRWQKLAYGSGIMPNLSRSPWLWLQVPFYLLAMLWTLLRLLRRERFDVLHAHWILPQGLIGVVAKTIHPIPLVTTAHGADAFALKGRLNSFIKQLVISRSDAWTANTSATSSAVGNKVSTPPARVYPMGVDIERFANGDRTALRALAAENDFLLLFVGRLVEKKGVDDLLRALALLPAVLKQRVRLWIIGDGDRRAALEKTAVDLAVDKQVRFWGMVRNQDLPNFYAAADLFVAPSTVARSGDSEGQGVVFLEAFAARLCVLATRSGGIDAVVHDRHTGILVRPNQPQEIAAAIEQLMCNAALRTTLAANAYDEVKERYDWHHIAGEFDKLYREFIPSAGHHN